MTKRLGFDTTPPTEFPKKEEYNKERVYVPPEERGPEDLRVRKMKRSWEVPRYY